MVLSIGLDFHPCLNFDYLQNVCVGLTDAADIIHTDADVIVAKKILKLRLIINKKGIITDGSNRCE